jgi:hypothetical protein
VTFFKDNTKFKNPQSGVQEVILILTYAAIILSISATISALTLTDEFGEIPIRASRKLGMDNPKNFEGGDWDILRYFHTRRSTQWIVYHCEPIRHLPAPFLIRTVFYRVDMLASSRFMRHYLYYFVCCYRRREADCHSHLHHRFARDLPTSVAIRCCILASTETSFLTYFCLICAVNSFSMGN